MTTVPEIQKIKLFKPNPNRTARLGLVLKMKNDTFYYVFFKTKPNTILLCLPSIILSLQNYKMI